MHLRFKTRNNRNYRNLPPNSDNVIKDIINKYKRGEGNKLTSSNTNSNFITKYGLLIVLISMAIGLAMAITSISVPNYYSNNGNKFGIFRGDGPHKKCLGILLDNNGQPKSPSTINKGFIKTCKADMSTSLIAIIFALVPIIIGIMYGISIGVNKNRKDYINNIFNKKFPKLLMIISIFGATIFQIISLILQITTPVNGDFSVSQIGGSEGKFETGFISSIISTIFFAIASLFLIAMIFI